MHLKKQKSNLESRVKHFRREEHSQNRKPRKTCVENDNFNSNEQDERDGTSHE